MQAHYNDLLKAGKIIPDKFQAKIAAQLADLQTQMVKYAKPKLIKSQPPQGLYIYGAVGRGKSMLMDAFFVSLPITAKKRVHFHEFMQEVHASLHESRSKKENDIIAQVAKKITKNLKVLCFDEFEVNDVTDAMILSKLFKTMAKRGVVFVITSNKKPADHYTNGLQRKTYLEFCEYLEGVVQLAALDSPKDYRQNQKAQAENYFSPLNYESTQKLKNRVKSLTREKFAEVVLEVGGRKLKLRAAEKIAAASFAELCETNLGAADYLAIAKNFSALVLENIPKMTEENRNEARRFINLIDILYENKTLLIATANAAPDSIYTEASSGAFEFKRTASRLTEMRGWKNIFSKT